MILVAKFLGVGVMTKQRFKTLIVVICTTIIVFVFLSLFVQDKSTAPERDPAGQSISRQAEVCLSLPMKTS